MKIGYKQRLSLITILLIPLGLAACSGGGSGNSGGSAAQSSSSAVFSLDTTSLTFATGNFLYTPSSQKITGFVSGLNGDHLYIRIEIAGNAVSSVSPITFIGDAFAQATVFPADARQLGLGTYTSTLTVYACTSDSTCKTGQLKGSPQVVNVTYTISGIATSPSSLSYSLNNASQASDFTQQLLVSLNPTQSWVVESDQTWLKLSGTNGDNTKLNVSIDETAGRLPNGTHTAHVVFTPAKGLQVSIPVTVTVDRTQLDFISPAVAVSTESHEVILHGAHLDAAGISGVRFGNQLITPITVVSENEIRVTPPKFAAGTYPVTLDGNVIATSAISYANLTVVDPAAYSAKALTYTVFYFLRGGEPSKIIYDAKRKKLYVLSYPTAGSRGDFNMYSYLGSDRWDATLMGTDVSKIYTMAMSTDGDWLLQGETSISFESALLYTPLDATGTGYGPYQHLTDATTQMKSVAVASDGQAIIVTASQAGGSFRPAYTMPSRLTGQLFAWDTPTPVLLSVPNSSDASVFYDGIVASSLDGSRVLLTSSMSSPGLTHMYQYDPIRGQLMDTGQTLKANAMQLDRTGGHILVNDMDLYDGNFSLLGHLPSTTVSTVLTPDGSKIYTYDSSGHIKRINAVTLAEESDWIPVAPAGDTSKSIAMTISPDGGTLFIVGTNAVIIEPVR